MCKGGRKEEGYSGEKKSYGNFWPVELWDGFYVFKGGGVCSGQNRGQHTSVKGEGLDNLGFAASVATRMP